MPKSRIYLMGIATLLGFPTIGITIVGAVEQNPWDFDFNWLQPTNLPYQLALGLGFGVLSGFIAWWMISRPQLKEIKMKYGVLIHQFKLNTWEIVFLSFSAGVGEEFLFRGVIQPYWGVWITAIFFVAIHGYLDPRDKKMMSYGLLMTVIIGIMGFMKIYFGLIAPMMAHFAIDVVLLYKLTNDKSFEFKPLPVPEFNMQEWKEEPETEKNNEDNLTNQE
tara:strand:- start:90935 stop:91594 length:660 start_codon:yes stop_codon:yes gene_type:complete